MMLLVGLMGLMAVGATAVYGFEESPNSDDDADVPGGDTSASSLDDTSDTDGLEDLLHAKEPDLLSAAAHEDFPNEAEHEAEEASGDEEPIADVFENLQDDQPQTEPNNANTPEELETASILLGNSLYEMFFDDEEDDDDSALYGGQADDALIGDSSDNLLYGDTGDDVILGGDGDDTLLGSAGADTLDGGAGDDVIVAGGGDQVTAGAGADSIFLGEWLSQDHQTEIQDFSTSEDSLIVVYDDTDGQEPDMSIEVDEDNPDTQHVVMNGMRIAQVNADAAMTVDQIFLIGQTTVNNLTAG